MQKAGTAPRWVASQVASLIANSPHHVPVDHRHLQMGWAKSWGRGRRRLSWGFPSIVEWHWLGVIISSRSETVRAAGWSDLTVCGLCPVGTFLSWPRSPPTPVLHHIHITPYWPSPHPSTYTNPSHSHHSPSTRKKPDRGTRSRPLGATVWHNNHDCSDN